MTSYTADSLKGEAYIDTRNIIEAAQDLRDEVLDEDTGEANRELDTDEAALLDFDDDQGGGIEDYPHGAQMIREDHFTEYAQELARDIGAINDDHGWPNGHIDWEAAATALQQDYTSVTFLGFDYWVR